jgi:hypothetical protein
MEGQQLADLVVRVNAAIAVLSWPFVIYEVLSKAPSIADLKTRLDLKRNQIFAAAVGEIEIALRPFWPRTAVHIIVEPEYREEQVGIFSDAANDAVRDCLADCELSFNTAARLRRILKRIAFWDKFTFWAVVCAAVLSLLALVIWFFFPSMPPVAAKTAIGVPVATVVIALIAATCRQRYLQEANDAILED